MNEHCLYVSLNPCRCLQKFWQLAKQVTEFMTWKQVEVSNIFCVLSVNQRLLVPHSCCIYGMI